MATKNVPASTEGACPQCTAELSDEAKKAAAELTFRRSLWWDDSIGTAAQLIAAGLAKPGEFPGDPGRGKTMVTYDEQRRQRGSAGFVTKAFTITRAPGKRFCVTVYVTKEEGQRRLAEDHAEAAAKKASSAAAAQAAAEEMAAVTKLAEMPATGDAFAKKAADMFWSAFDSFFLIYCQRRPTESGFRFAGYEIDEFEALAFGLFHAIRDADTTFDEARRLKPLMDARAKAAKVNMPLQRLLASAIALPPQR